MFNEERQVLWCFSSADVYFRLPEAPVGGEGWPGAVGEHHPSLAPSLAPRGRARGCAARGGVRGEREPGGGGAMPGLFFLLRK